MTSYRDSVRLIDWTGKEYSKVKGIFRGFNRDSSRFWTYDKDSARLCDWTGKEYGRVRGEIRTFNRDSSLFYFSQDKYTAFYNWDGQLTCVYRGEVFIFKADNQHVMMRIKDGNLIQMHLLYSTIHAFMQHEVAELTPEERVQYGLQIEPEDTPKYKADSTVFIKPITEQTAKPNESAMKVPDGNPNSNVLKGLRFSNGSNGFGGRGVVSAPKLQENSQKEGKVVLEVCIDAKGNVISAKQTMVGSTTADEDLINAAIRNSQQYKFEEGSEDKQCGTITYNFVIR